MALRVSRGRLWITARCGTNGRLEELRQSKTQYQARDESRQSGGPVVDPTARITIRRAAGTERDIPAMLDRGAVSRAVRGLLSLGRQRHQHCQNETHSRGSDHEIAPCCWCTVYQSGVNEGLMRGGKYHRSAQPCLSGLTDRMSWEATLAANERMPIDADCRGFRDVR